MSLRPIAIALLLAVQVCSAQVVDSDGDTVADSVEIALGTDPYDSGSWPLGLRPDNLITGEGSLVVLADYTFDEFQFGIAEVAVVGARWRAYDESGWRITLNWVPESQARALVSDQEVMIEFEGDDFLRSFNFSPGASLTYHYTPPPPTSCGAASCFSDWSIFHFGWEVDPEDDSDGDAVPALIEYAFNLDPWTSDRSKSVASSGGGLPVLMRAGETGRPSAFQFVRLDDSELTYELQSSGDLSAWGSVPAGGWVISPVGGGYEKVTVPLASGDVRRWYRVMISY